MKILHFKTVELEGKPFEYRKMLKQVLRTPMEPERGVSIEEMQKSCRILNLIDEVEGDDLKIEDADYDFLCEKITAFRWAMSDQVILDFVHAMKNAEKYVEPKKEAAKA